MADIQYSFFVFSFLFFLLLLLVVLIFFYFYFYFYFFAQGISFWIYSGAKLTRFVCLVSLFCFVFSRF